MGYPEPPHPEAFVAMGDFNMLEGSPEYAGMAGRPDHEFGLPAVATKAVDAAVRLAGDDARSDAMTTWVDPKRPADASRRKRIDYVFTAAVLAPRLSRLWVDREAVGSDHLPVWVEFA